MGTTIFDKPKEDGAIKITKEELEKITISVQRRKQLKSICEIGNSIIQEALEHMDMADYKFIEPELNALQDIFESAYNFECVMEMVRKGMLHIGYEPEEK